MKRTFASINFPPLIARVKFSYLVAFSLLIWFLYNPTFATNSIITLLSDAWFSAGIYVAISLVVFFIIEKVIKIDFNEVLEKGNKKVIFYSSLLGAFPGCGGAIIVAIAAVRQKASFGALVAALTTTMGDAAFLLLAKKPLQTLLILAIQITVGTITGILIDYLVSKKIIRIKFKPPKSKAKLKEIQQELAATASEHSLIINSEEINCHSVNCNSTETISKDSSIIDRNHKNDQIDKKSIYKKFVYIAFIVIIPICIFWSVNNIVNSIEKNDSFSYLSFYYLGALIAAIAFILWMVDKADLHIQSYESEKKYKHYYDKIAEIINITFFVVAWVFIANLLYFSFIQITGLDLKSLFDNIAIFIPLMAIFIGFIPGCGPQIIVASLYVTDVIPFSAQLGNSISNDGDAMLPALSIAPKIVVMATIYSAIPAFILAYGWFFLFE